MIDGGLGVYERVWENMGVYGRKILAAHVRCMRPPTQMLRRGVRAVWQMAALHSVLLAGAERQPDVFSHTLP